MHSRFKLKVSEIFSSIQGEGRHSGEPVTFLRLAGCTKSCAWCDSKYHKDGVEWVIAGTNGLISHLQKLNSKIDVLTGGEPTLQWSGVHRLLDVGHDTYGFSWHLETNADLLTRSMVRELNKYCDYICASPKDKVAGRRCAKFLSAHCNFDVKVVTNLKKVGVELIKFATMLMPLTTGDVEKDLEIRKRVWQYCIDNQLRYSPRLHIDLFGNRRGV